MLLSRWNFSKMNPFQNLFFFSFPPTPPFLPSSLGLLSFPVSIFRDVKEEEVKLLRGLMEDDIQLTGKYFVLKDQSWENRDVLPT